MSHKTVFIPDGNIKDFKALKQALKQVKKEKNPTFDMLKQYYQTNVCINAAKKFAKENKLKFTYTLEKTHKGEVLITFNN